MNFHVLTLFPQMILDGMNTSIMGRAISKGKRSVRVWGITHNEAVEADLHCGQKREVVKVELLHEEKAAVFNVESLETRQGR